MDIGVEVNDLIRVFNEICKYSGTVLKSACLLSIPEVDSHVDKCGVQSVAHGGPGPNVLHINIILSVLISSGERFQFLLSTETA